jgi:hypothetical protein
MNDFSMHGSMFLVGSALAIAGGVGVFLPRGDRAGVALALLAGAGVGIAGLALGWSVSNVDDVAEAETWWRVFFGSSIAGFATVVMGVTVSWRRARSHPSG